MAGSRGVAGSAIYSATKAALNTLTRCWAAELGPQGIRVNAVAPGLTLTEGTKAMYDASTLSRLAGEALARRNATADEIARVIAFVSSSEANLIHGAVIAADGGRSAV
nr:SDR family oxidoreductase [Mycobacterium adipatum]